MSNINPFDKSISQDLATLEDLVFASIVASFLAVFVASNHYVRSYSMHMQRHHEIPKQGRTIPFDNDTASI